VISAFGVEHGEISKKLSRDEKRNLAIGAGTGAAVTSATAAPVTGLMYGIGRNMAKEGRIKSAKGAAMVAVPAAAAGGLAGAGAGGAYVGAKRWKKKRSAE